MPEERDKYFDWDVMKMKATGEPISSKSETLDQRIQANENIV